jgi:hypothetical protein
MYGAHSLCELLHTLVRELRRQKDWDSLVALACTSREVHRGTVAYIWDSVESIIPLLELLPHADVRVIHENGTRNVVSLTHSTVDSASSL